MQWSDCRLSQWCRNWNGVVLLTFPWSSAKRSWLSSIPSWRIIKRNIIIIQNFNQSHFERKQYCTKFTIWKIVSTHHHGCSHSPFTFVRVRFVMACNLRARKWACFWTHAPLRLKLIVNKAFSSHHQHQDMWTFSCILRQKLHDLEAIIRKCGYLGMDHWHGRLIFHILNVLLATWMAMPGDFGKPVWTTEECPIRYASNDR